MNKKGSSNMLDTIKIWARILTYVDGSKIIYLLMFFGYTSLGAVGSYNVGNLLKQITNGVIGSDSNMILRGVLIFIGISILTSAGGWMFFHIYVSRTKMKAEYKLKQELFKHMLNRPLPRKANAHSGDSLSRLLNDSDSVANALSWDTLGIMWPINAILTSGVITIIINWKIGVLTFAIGLLFLFITSKVAVPMRKNNDQIKKSESKATQRMLDFLSASGSVRIMGIELPLIGKLEEATGEVKMFTFKNIMLNAWYSTLGSAVGITSTVLILSTGFYLYTKGEIELGNVLLIYQFSSNAVYGLVRIGRSLTKFQKTAASAQRVFDIFDSPEEDKRHEMPELNELIKPGKPALEVSDLSFKYREELDYALKNISLNIEKGAHVALVGESGSGKSTFFKLLLGLYSIDEGEIYIEGVNQKEASLKSIRENFSYVSQDSPLFDGSIFENIKMGVSSLSKTDIKKAAILAGTHDFILALPNGYDSEVGELGAKISGGQKQRIAITRAIIHNAPVLLLDEATSSLDSYNETKIQEALLVAAENKTMIVAAHRLSTVREADKIFVFDKGTVVEQGTHNELKALDGIYAHLIKSQQLK